VGRRGRHQGRQEREERREEGLASLVGTRPCLRAQALPQLYIGNCPLQYIYIPVV